MSHSQLCYLSHDKVVVGWDADVNRGFFFSKMAVDADGDGGNVWNDPDFQADTTLHHDGRPINSNKVPGIVLPPKVILAVPGIVLGCKCRALNTINNKEAFGVVYDVGPHEKIGEASVEMARRLGVPESPVTGGEERHIIFYEFFPGVPAEVDGITYILHPYGHRNTEEPNT